MVSRNSRVSSSPPDSQTNHWIGCGCRHQPNARSRGGVGRGGEPGGVGPKPEPAAAAAGGPPGSLPPPARAYPRMMHRCNAPSWRCAALGTIPTNTRNRLTTWCGRFWFPRCWTCDTIASPCGRCLPRACCRRWSSCRWHTTPCACCRPTHFAAWGPRCGRWTSAASR
jgi:hypothetical protein